jgi:hypothetical protein
MIYWDAQLIYLTKIFRSPATQPPVLWVSLNKRRESPIGFTALPRLLIPDFC